MPDRCTPDYERTLAKMGSVLPYHRARSLLDEFFPLGDTPEVETIRQRTLHVGARLERSGDAANLGSAGEKARSIALAIDGGHVKAVRSHQGRSFEVFVAQVSNDDSEHVAFSSMPGDRPKPGGQNRVGTPSRPGFPRLPPRRAGLRPPGFGRSHATKMGRSLVLAELGSGRAVRPRIIPATAVQASNSIASIAAGVFDWMAAFERC